MKQCWEQKAENRPTFSGKVLLGDYFCYVSINSLQCSKREFLINSQLGNRVTNSDAQ